MSLVKQFLTLQGLIINNALAHASFIVPAAAVAASGPKAEQNPVVMLTIPPKMTRFPKKHKSNQAKRYFKNLSAVSHIHLIITFVKKDKKKIANVFLF